MLNYHFVKYVSISVAVKNNNNNKNVDNKPWNTGAAIKQAYRIKSTNSP